MEVGRDGGIGLHVGLSRSNNNVLTVSLAFFALIDLFSILPYYIELALHADTTAFFRFSILRTFRLLRVFRPFRYSSTILLTIEVSHTLEPPQVN